jgi:hypothetical protein
MAPRHHPTREVPLNPARRENGRFWILGMATMFRIALSPSPDELSTLLQRNRTRRGYRWRVGTVFKHILVRRCAKQGGDAMPRENSSGTNLSYTFKDNSSLTETTARGSALFYAMRRGRQGDGGLRPGDWLLLSIGMALIIGVALVVIGVF